MQREQFRQRFFAFAKWQAKWRQLGFHIEHAELELNDIAFPVDGQPFMLKGPWLTAPGGAVLSA